jgi:class 3 adenylate cyclase
LKHFLSAILFIVLSFAGSAQGRHGRELIDSLLAELPKMKGDTAEVILLDNISYAYCYANPDEGLRYATKSLELAQKIGWKKGEAAANNDIGNAYRQKGAYAPALDYYFRALRIDESLGNKRGIGMVTLNIGAVYFGQKNYPKSLEYYRISLEKTRETGDKDYELIVLGDIGNTYYAMGNYEEAFAYMQKALTISEALGDKRGTINQMGNIGNIYGSLGKNKEALNWYFKALQIAKEIGDQQLISVNEGNIGETYLDIAKDTTTGGEDKAANISNAITWLQMGIAGAKSVDFSQAVIEFSKTLSEAYAKQGNYKGAFEAYQQYTQAKDSVFSIENNEKMAHLETQRALELKDKDILIASLEVKRKRNERWYFIAGIVLLLGISVMLFRNFKKQQHSNTLLSREKKRSDDLLLNILPGEVAEELKESGTSAARQYDNVSVLFTDFVDFTEAAEIMGPQALVKELHDCFSEFDAIMERNNLEKIKTIGDAYMAVSGMPATDPDHARNAVQAALEIRDFIAGRNRQTQTFEIRIGINSGAVVAGIVGVKKFAYDIWGDTVNTANRMEQFGAAGKVNISRSTYDLVKDIYVCTYRGRVAAKNKGEIEMYFVDAGVRS